MSNPNHVARLLKGVEVWNQWRQENWNIKPDLTGMDLKREHGFKRSPLWDSRKRKINLAEVNFGGVDLSDADLRGADMTGANVVDAVLAGIDLRDATLKNADFKGSHLRGAQFVGAILHDANLIETDLKGTDFWQADLAGADLEAANLEQSNFNTSSLRGANLSRANLYECDLRYADLRGANMDHAGVIGVKYERSSMRGRYQGVRGIESTYGDAIFRRDAVDQDYIDTLAFRWRRSPLIIVFWLWSIIDYGRSLSRILWLSVAIILAFGTAFLLNPQAISMTASSDPLFSPYYASFITFVSLGLPASVTAQTALGQLLLSLETMSGFLLLAVLLSVLLRNISRRS